MIRINQVNVSAFSEDPTRILRKKASQLLKMNEQEIRELHIVRRSIDARKKPEIFYSYVIDVAVEKEEKIVKRIKNANISLVQPVRYQFPHQIEGPIKERPVIIGCGPAGLFCGYFLARAGFRPILLERGKDVDNRMQDVEAFWKTGILRPESNVQFGEGGAGTFSDGKLNTLVKDKDGRNRAVLETFVSFGAKEEIVYDAKPHIGTDVLCHIIKAMREEIIHLGGEVRFEQKLTRLVTECNAFGEKQLKAIIVNQTQEIPCQHLVLAIGHSARDTFEMLLEDGIPMESKAFAVGLRVEHPQEMINKSQYGISEMQMLGAAPYKVAAKAENGRGVYSFCMCPGGYVVNASSEEGKLAVNGMSYSARDGKNANSAVIVSVTPEDFGSDHPLAGIVFQRELEKKAYELAGGKIPVERYGDFKEAVLKEGSKAEALDGRQPLEKEQIQGLMPQNKGQWEWAEVHRILPDACNHAFVDGMTAFGRMIEGFDREDALLSGVESRTSSPVRILRDASLESSVKGIYPCGEGAGYAGGITSAAMDGIRVAEATAASLLKINRRR